MARHANELLKGGNPMALRSLAAAYAETGRMAEALETAQLALDAATLQGNAALAGVCREERQLYWEGKPARDPRLQESRLPSGKQ